MLKPFCSLPVIVDKASFFRRETARCKISFFSLRVCLLVVSVTFLCSVCFYCCNCFFLVFARFCLLLSALLCLFKESFFQQSHYVCNCCPELLCTIKIHYIEFQKDSLSRVNVCFALSGANQLACRVSCTELCSTRAISSIVSPLRLLLNKDVRL